MANRLFRNLDQGQEDSPEDVGAFRPAGLGRRASAEPSDDPSQAALPEGAAEQDVPASGATHPQGQSAPPHARTSSPRSAAFPPEDSRTRAASYRLQEIRWLHGRVETLESQVRWRTIGLGLSSITALIAIIGLAAVLLRGPEPLLAALGVAPAPEAAGPQPAAIPAPGGTFAGDADRQGGVERAALTAALERIEELEAAAAEREAMVGSLRAELADTQSEAQRLAEQLAVSRRGIERLNELLATVPVGPSQPAGDAPAPGQQQPTTGQAPPAADGPEGVPEARTEEAPPQPGTAQAAVAPGQAAGSPPAGAPADATQTNDTASYVATRPVNLRTGPTTASEVIGIVDEGDTVRRIGNQGTWLQVEYSDTRVGELTGWVYGEFLRPVGPPGGGGASG